MCIPAVNPTAEMQDIIKNKIILHLSGRSDRWDARFFWKKLFASQRSFDRWDASLLGISAGLTNSAVVVFNRWDVVWHALNPSGRCARCSAISAVATVEMFVIIPAKKWDFFCSGMFRSKPYRASDPFTTIHSNLWGSSRVPNRLHSKWFITFIDDLLEIMKIMLIFPILYL